MRQRIRIAHFSDLHLGPLPQPTLPQLISKRFFGYVNWHRNRKSAAGMALLEDLVSDCHRQQPDHVMISGDLVNIALPQEFSQAHAWLNERFAPSQTTLVLGNHDAYVPGARERAREAFAPYMAGSDGRSGWVFARQLGAVTVIGINTGVATLPAVASGAVGAAQRDTLANLLDRYDNTVKIAMLHHPPDRTLARGRRGLDDCDAVRQVLASGGVHLVVHGHIHQPSRTALETVRGTAPICGVPSASSDGSHYPLGSYAIYEISVADGPSADITMVRRGPERCGAPVRELERTVISEANAVASDGRE